MARITTYAIDSAISGKDKLVGSDAEDSNITKNYLIADLANYIGCSRDTIYRLAKTDENKVKRRWIRLISEYLDYKMRNFPDNF